MCRLYAKLTIQTIRKIELRKSGINSSTFGFTRTPYYMIIKVRRVCKSLKSAPFPPAEGDEFSGSSKFRQNISSNRISRPKANPKCVLAKVLRQYIKWQQWIYSLDRIKRNIYGFHYLPFDINFHSKSRLPKLFEIILPKTLLETKIIPLQILIGSKMKWKL